MHLRRWMTALLLTLMLTSRAFAATGEEQRKIDYLIHTVEKLKGAHFIRNGKSYSSGIAIRYIHMRLRNADEPVHTAEDFIARYATRSSTTGRPYLIRFEDGHTEPTASYLHRVLAQWHEPAPAEQDASLAPAH